ncbi:hypothetical protein O4220_19640 [Rhodococcus ruber]|uniref:DUF6575 domain-containing protein n=1 Tax=Rhodococcus ruber TaxID=1830 RepID=A0ABT4MIU3_9NOCA|nr:DUF6575 domain-containing protein [Rhodococcus ruber]MCZ4520728.1 hypothetical protein [Rhodococcus ruber]
MNWFPRGDPLGELTLVETFVYYDGPRLFSCISRTGGLFLAIWVEESTEADVWLYLPVSELRLQTIRSGGIDIRDAFFEAEETVYQVSIANGRGEDSVSYLNGKDIPEYWLSEPGERLELPTSTLAPATSIAELTSVAQAEHRGRMRVEVEPISSVRSTAPTRSVGRLLIQLQNTLDGFGLSLLDEKGGSRGPIPARVARETVSEVVGLSAASFVIDIAATNYDDLHGSTFAQCADAIVELFNAADAPSSELRTLIRPRHQRAIVGFRRLLGEFSSLNGPATIASVSSLTEYSEAALNVEQIDRLYQTLSYLSPDEEQPPISGLMYLLGGQVEKQTFELRSDSLDNTFRGYIDEQAIPAFLEAPLGSNYDVTLHVSSTTDEFTSDKKFTYRLMKISPAKLNS